MQLKDPQKIKDFLGLIYEINQTLKNLSEVSWFHKGGVISIIPPSDIPPSFTSVIRLANVSDIKGKTKKALGFKENIEILKGLEFPLKGTEFFRFYSNNKKEEFTELEITNNTFRLTTAYDSLEFGKEIHKPDLKDITEVNHLHSPVDVFPANEAAFVVSFKDNIAVTFQKEDLLYKKFEDFVEDIQNQNIVLGYTPINKQLCLFSVVQHKPLFTLYQQCRFISGINITKIN
jgi:hypothetical protein